MRSYGVLLIFLLPGICLGAKNEQVISDAVYTSPVKLIKVEGERRLNLFCTGKGSPVVIFDSGLGDGTKAWGLVQPEVSKKTKTCSYDRAGLGFSDPATKPGVSKNAVEDLRNLLQNAKIQTPYILVGHSYGGMNVKLYAETYPTEVAGLVLVDPSHEDMGKVVFALDPPLLQENLQYLKDLNSCLQLSSIELKENTKLYSLCVGNAGPRYSSDINAIELEKLHSPTRMAAWISEMTNIWRRSADQVRASYRPLGNMPIILLKSPPTLLGSKETPELRVQKNRGVSRILGEIIGMSSRGHWITVEETGHYIQLDQPESVISAIQRIIDKLSKN